MVSPKRWNRFPEAALSGFAAYGIGEESFREFSGGITRRAVDLYQLLESRK
jgi:hypothetical protein